MKKKIDTKNLVEKIAKLARERMTSGDVVSLADIKNHRSKKRTPTLLLIEDDETVRRALQRIFDTAGYRVLAAGDGTELTDVLSETYVDLILLDVGLPWINGYELAQMMKEHPDLQRVPLVFISGHGDHAAIKKGFDVGAHDYITKPFRVETVLKTVSTLLQLNE